MIVTVYVDESGTHESGYTTPSTLVRPIWVRKPRTLVIRTSTRKLRSTGLAADRVAFACGAPAVAYCLTLPVLSSGPWLTVR